MKPSTRSRSARRDQRADDRLGIEWSPDLRRRHGGPERVDDVVVAGARREDAGLRDAGLTVVHDRVRQQAGDRGGEVGVVEDDRRRLPTEFERAALELRATQRRDTLPRCGRSGEADLVDVGVRHEVLADLAARGHDADHTRRQPDLFEHVGEQVRVEWRLGRGLEHDRGAGRERGPHLQHDREQRDVPRHDATRDANRLAAHQHRAERALPELFERELACEVRVVVEHHRGREDLAHDRERDRRTHLLTDRSGDVLVARLDELRDLLHDVGALAGGHAGPRAGVECAARCGHRAVDVLVRCVGNGRDDFFRER